MSAPLYGPWMHGSPSEFGTFHVNTIYDADGVSVAQVYQLPNNTTIEDTDPNRWGPGLARARLIAAAPELLEALQHIADFTAYQNCDNCNEMNAVASAAIAKATQP